MNMKKIRSGFSLVELLVALGISAVVVTTAFGTLAQVYNSQKKVLTTQDF